MTLERSNAHSRRLLDVIARFNPEMAGQIGVDGLDEEIVDLEPGFEDRLVEATGQALQILRSEKRSEQDPAVAQDLEILIRSGEDIIEETELERKLLLPYINLPRILFQGIRSLLDDQVEARRRPAARVRLRKYAGMDGGPPVVDLAMSHTRERFPRQGLLGPARSEIEKDLADGAFFVDGIRELIERYGLEDGDGAFAALASQLESYAGFVRREILPRCRVDFRLPPEIYAFKLRQYGNDMPLTEMVGRAGAAYVEILGEMSALAPLVARQRGLRTDDYREVILDLKKSQIEGDSILAHYVARNAALESIIRERNLVSLPERDMVIRLASEAESAAIPAPHMRPPRLVGNTGQLGEIVLPLRMPAADGGLAFDDFSFDAVSWTLSAHEGRPGHELQFASMVERGVSIARSVFAFNSVNVEGWGLYAESVVKPHMPLEGQLISLQHRLLRAARAFLDPDLQSGGVTREQALCLLRDRVVVSEAMATQEVDRYMFRSPGQAPSYFCGYSRLLELRAVTERALRGAGRKMDLLAYHDFILEQGLLPPALLAKAVRDGFTKPRLDDKEG